MANRIQASDEPGRRAPDPREEPFERPRDAADIAPVADGEPHRADYDDEVGSQRRLRWMTQALVIPSLSGGLWVIACAFAYSARLVLCQSLESRARFWVGCALSLAATALLFWFIARGKIGLRRRWLNAVLIAAMFFLGGRYGWRAAAGPSECPGAAAEDDAARNP